MSKSNIKIKKYLGYKFFKELEDGSIELIRLIGIEEFNDKVTILNIDTNKQYKIPFTSLKDYTPLKPYGLISFSIVKCFTNPEKTEFIKDVIVGLYKLIDLEIGINEPYALCRQSINDFFYNILSTTENHPFVGISVSRDNCPPNIGMENVALCDDVLKYEMINIYIDDTLEDMLMCINQPTYDKVLLDLFNAHCDSIVNGIIIQSSNVKQHNGWCKTLHELLTINNFMTDFDMMCNSTSIDFNLQDYLIPLKDEDNEAYKLNDEALEFFNYTFKVNAVDTLVIKYANDVDLADFNHTNYTLLRYNDSLYIVSYLVDGEYNEKDLEEKSNQIDVSTKLRLKFFDKYGK